MSILIKGMEMPKSCRDCDIEQEGLWCGALEGYQNTRYFTNERRENCPLIEVPPHGRLIDADAFERTNQYFLDLDFINPKYEDTLADLINNAPTVVEAEEGE